MNQERRRFLNLTAGMIISTGLSLFANSKELDKGDFLHGVASGDPLHDQVIIWTRVTPLRGQKDILIAYEVSLDRSFKKIVHSGNTMASLAHDYTVKIDVHSLQANTYYYYRFKTANAVSTIGKTLTLPKQTQAITLAIFSCANYTNGYFNAYRDACQFQKINAVIHLGDYIYEYGMLDKNNNEAYGTKNAKKIGRELPKDNDKELITLNDYRKRYALYRQDPDLQKLHELFPFICIWDDHEVCNNAYTFETAQGIKRKEASIQAYYEWLPIRPPFGEEDARIFRSFNFGTLFSLHMLDTRLIARDKQLDYSHYYSKSGELNLQRLQTDLKNNSRSILGKEQLQWLENKIKKSTSSWQIIAQQVKMSPSLVPLEVIELATQYEHSDDRKQKALLTKKLIQALNETSRIQARILLNDKKLSKEERKRVAVMLPYNLDAWDGYAKEREALFEILTRFKTKNLILSGDAHYSWSNKLLDKFNNEVGIEIGVTSVTSPGLEEDYNIDNMAHVKSLENYTHIFDANSLYCNYTDRGYVILEIQKNLIKTHWRYVDTIEKREYKTLAYKNKMMKIGLIDNKYRTEIH